MLDNEVDLDHTDASVSSWSSNKLQEIKIG